MKRDNPVTAYLSDREKSKLKKWSNECDKPQSQLVREAIIEYMDNDRTARLEEKVDRCLTLLENDEHTHTNPAQGKVPKRARSIAKRIYANHTVPVQENDVEIAIEDIAGGDDRTLKKYKEQLKKRGLLYEHPMQPVWTDDKEHWVKWVESATVDSDIYERVDDYGMTTNEYHEIAERVL